jgi:putative ABC transport system permease protein
MSGLRFQHRRDRFTFGDVFTEAVQGLSGRPGRLLLTLAATMLGIGSLVATVGLAQTGSNQLTSRFDEISGTQAVVRAVEPDSALPGRGMPWDADERVLRLNGVVGAGLLAEIEVGGTRIAAAPVFDPMEPPRVQPLVLAATVGLLDAVKGRVLTGEYFNTFHQQHLERVAVLGRDAAIRLGVTRVDNQPTVFIGQVSFVVVGIVADMERRQDLLDAVIVPQTTARRYLGLSQPGDLQIQLRLGAGDIVREQAPFALDPEDPTAFEVVAPSATSEFRESVTADMNSIFLILGGVALLIGGLSIAVVTSMSVMERRGEIGLKRALGATKAQIALQFMAESVISGILGGLIGSALGTLGVVAGAAWNQWTPVLYPSLTAAATALGALIGLLAGLAPAAKAANLQPSTALQEGT